MVGVSRVSMPLLSDAQYELLLGIAFIAIAVALPFLWKIILWASSPNRPPPISHTKVRSS